jgi:uncharacterized paraquat-inducible protein A
VSPTKYLNGPCSHCGAPIKFAAQMVGTTAQCPRCGKTTELLLEQPAEEPALPRKVVFWTVSSVLVLLLGLAASLYALKRTQRWMEQHKPTASTNSPASSNPKP